MTTKKTLQPRSTFTKNDSSDDNSDLESLDSSFGPFAAIPKEFRPLPASLKNEHAMKSLNENKQILSNQKPISNYENTSEKVLPKKTPPKTQKRVVIEQRNLSNQNQTPVGRKNANFLENLQKCHQVPNNTTNVENKTYNSSSGNRKTLHLCPQKTTNKLPEVGKIVWHTKKTQHGNGIRYEYVQNQEHRTVKMNFEFSRKHHPLYNEDLKMDSKQENEKQLKKKDFTEQNKNFCHRVERDSKKEKDSALFQENAVKWNSSLNRDKLIENKRENGKIFKKVPLTVLYQENIVKCNSPLKLDESSSDTDDEIKWTIIQENKVTITAKNIDGKNFPEKQTNNEHMFTRPRPQFRPNKPRKYYRKKNFNKNFKNQKNNPKQDTPGNEDTENIVHKNNLQLNNNSKHDNTEIRSSGAQKECCQDSVTLYPQRQEVKNDVETEFITNTRKNMDDPEPNLYLQKIDNSNPKLTEDTKDFMLYYGREMSDLIIGSYNALSLFISMFNDWKRLRLELIVHFEYLEKKLGESSKKYTKYKDLLAIAKAGASVASAVPLPHVSIAAKVISIFTSLFSALLSASEKKNSEVEESNDISLAATRDTNASNELYMYGLQCGQTFEETAKLFEEFHKNAGDPVVFEKDSPEIATFIRGILEYKPRHRFFHKKLHKCFQELLHNSTSEFGKRLCEPFLMYPRAIDVIGFLDWRFRHDDFNGESVRFELEQIEALIKDKDTSIKDLAVRTQNCTRFLKDELKFLEGCVKDICTLFDNLEPLEIKERYF